jgi:hypothetical protein
MYPSSRMDLQDEAYQFAWLVQPQSFEANTESTLPKILGLD